MSKFIIFDRDGTLIDLKTYLVDPRHVSIRAHTINGLKLLDKHGFKFGIVTNQSVIARGKATIKQVELVNYEMIKLFGSHGISFEFLFYCPHSPVDMCACRKPEIELGLKAIKNFNIDTTKSYMIGDMKTDIEFGKALKFKTVKLGIDESSIADFSAKNIFYAAKWIVNQK
jgi:D-glycero-D-manno-heptose 1,7-bisphosphate phosphatase